uniref:Protein prib n=1 Tax=Melanopsichium pennsylvanicum 4 TaxID=1398559 RepID=A0A077QXK8_9BASI|nr:protein prib [Melanopsichium pennsylvanicum 4]
MDVSMDEDAAGERPRTRNSQACLDLATRAREQSEALQRQLEQQLHSRAPDSKLDRSSPNHESKSVPHQRNVAWDHPTSAAITSSYSHPADLERYLAHRHGSDGTTSNHQSPLSAATSSSSISHQSSSIPTAVSSNGHFGSRANFASNGSSRRTSKYHDGLLIRESRMPPSSTNPLLCLSEAALGKRCTDSDSEEDELAAEIEHGGDGACSPVTFPDTKKRGTAHLNLDEAVNEEDDAQARSARDIAAMLESSGWTRSCLGHAACERASYFSGASASASWDTRRCDPLDKGIVTMHEVHRLFKLFMDVIHEQFCILDPIIHNVETIMESSNFLFSVILAIATSVDRSPRSIQQFQRLRALVDSLVVEVLSRNVKSVEVVKGLIVWPMWAHLTPLMAEDRAWLLIGTAARMAKELDLAMRDDAPQEDETARRHARDRSRTWALAAIMERSFSSFSGQRPNTTLDVDWGTLNDWLKSPVSLDGDIQVVAFLHLRRIEEITRTRIFSQSYYEVGSIESIRVSANVLLDAWSEAWCEHPCLTKHRLTSTIMRIISLHIQVLINTHAIRESDRRRAICEASNMRILRICGDSVKAARENCVVLLTDACRLALDNLQGHAHTLSRIVSAMLGWSGVHLLKNGPIETRGLVVQLGLMLAGDPQDSTYSRSFPRFYGRFILSLSAELVERDRAEKSRKKRQRLRESSHMSGGSSVLGALSPRAVGDAIDTRRSVASGRATQGHELKKPVSTSVPGAATTTAPVSEMALAFESAAQSSMSGRPPFLGSSGSIFMSPSMPGAAGYQAPYATTPGVSNASHGMTGMVNSGGATSPLSSAYRNSSIPASTGANSTSTLDSVTNSWLGTDDLLDQYMQSILPIFNDFDHATNNTMVNSIGGGGGIGVPISEVGR